MQTPHVEVAARGFEVGEIAKPGDLIDSFDGDLRCLVLAQVGMDGIDVMGGVGAEVRLIGDEEAGAAFAEEGTDVGFVF